MTNVRTFSIRRTAAAGVLTLSLLGASACSAINEQATTKPYMAADGWNFDLKNQDQNVQFRNMTIVTNGKDKPGRLLGKVVNDSAAPVSIELTAGSEKIQANKPIQVKAKGALSLSEKEIFTFPKTPRSPGELTDVTVTIGSESIQAKIPVLDGTLPEYRKYIPGGASPVPSHSRGESTKSGEKEKAPAAGH